MRRFISLFLSLILAVSLGWGSVAHSIEGSSCADLGTPTVSHFDGDGDQTSGDADKAYPHHHAECHGHHVGVPATVSPLPTPLPRLTPQTLTTDVRAVMAVIDPELRPPIA